MRTKQEIAAAAKKMAEEFSHLSKSVTSENASQAYVFGIVSRAALELADLVYGLAVVDDAASDADHGDARYLHEIAARAEFGVTRWHDLFQLSRDGVAMFSGTNRAAVGFILGWERSRVDSNQSDAITNHKPKWDIKKLDAIAVRIGLEVARCDDRIVVFHNGLTMFAGDPEPAAGFLLGWERCCNNQWHRMNRVER